MKRRFIKGNNLWGVCDEKCPEDTEGGVLKNVLHNYSLHFRLLPSEWQLSLSMKASMKT